jgi:diguanylate cyclase
MPFAAIVKAHLMQYAHAPERARAYAEQALALMGERDIPPHPNNFSVWYSYSAGEHPDLKKVLDILMASDEEFTEARSAAVFSKFCASPLESVPLHLIADKVETELATAVSLLQQACQDAASYGASLEAAEGQAAGIRHADDLIRLLSGILTQSRAIARQSRDVEGQLRRSWAEVGHLKEELAGARREAMTDALTGLANRKMFDFVLREAAMEAMETGEPLALLLLDIDHFKLFNDTYGHNVGDHVLKLLASVLRDTCKGQDTPARYGGEEFAVVLPRTEAADAGKLAESIRQRVAGKTVIHRKTGEQLGRVHVSIGVAGFAFGEPLRQLVERADRALYKAKRTGRNRVVTELRSEQKQVAFGA